MKRTTLASFRRITVLLCCCAGLCAQAEEPKTPAVSQAGFAAKSFKGRKIAVAVYPRGAEAPVLASMVQSRMERVLRDNNIAALDEKKAEEMKDVWKRMEDPNYVARPEDFAGNPKYDIHGVALIYVSADVTPGLADYFTATAQADIRFVDAAARVDANVSTPMGAMGRPPSDGLTRESALVNAVQRSLDEACGRLGLDIADPADPQSVRLKLEGPVAPPADATALPKPAADSSLASCATMFHERWKSEEVSASAADPAGALAALAGYITDRNLMRRPPQSNGSRIHLIDAKNRRALSTLECHELAPAGRGTPKVTDVVFVSNWRYLAAVSGKALFFWDTERGRLLNSVKFDKSADSPKLEAVRAPSGTYLVVTDKSRSNAYKLVREGGGTSR